MASDRTDLWAFDEDGRDRLEESEAQLADDREDSGSGTDSDSGSSFTRSAEGDLSWREDVLYSDRFEARMWRRITAPVALMMAVGLSWASVLAVKQGQPGVIGCLVLIPPLAIGIAYFIFRAGRNRARDGTITLTDRSFAYLPGPMERRQTLIAGGLSAAMYATGNGPITRPLKAGRIFETFEQPWERVKRIRVWEDDSVIELFGAAVPLLRCHCPPERFQEILEFVRERRPDVAIETGVWRWI